MDKLKSCMIEQEYSEEFIDRIVDIGLKMVEELKGSVN